MIPYITYREPDAAGELQYFVLQKEFPHYVGRISEIPTNNVIHGVPITGHNLWVAFAGTVRGNYMPSYKNVQQEIESVFTGMALWFYSERIMKEPKKYNKFKIQSDVSKPS